MTSFTLIESTSAPLPITDDQAAALQEMGSRLASKLAWWGDSPDDEDEPAEPRSVIRCHRAPSGWVVRVADAIGLIATGDVQLIVQPKIPQSHLLYLLAESEEVPRLQPSVGALESGASFWELICRWFVSAAQRVLRRDLARDYETRREVLTVVRGHVDPLQTTRDLLRGRIAIHCEFDDFTANTALNRLLREASRLVAASPVLPWDLRRAALGVSIRMDEVDDLHPGDILAVPDRRTSYYGDAITLAKQIIRGVDRRLAYGTNKSWTFLFRTPEAVEAGVRKVLARAFPGRVKKKGITLAPSSLTLNPDLVFDDGSEVADVKYKINRPSWRRSDLYEVVAFATGFGASRSAIIGFGSTSLPEPPSLTVGTVEVRHFTWPTDFEIPPTNAGTMLCAAIAAWLDE